MSTKIQPKTTKDIIGNKEAILKLKTFIAGKVPILIYGDCGIGKTSTVYAVANEMEKQVIEYNSSIERNIDKLQEAIRLVRANSFLNPLFLFDEADGLKDNSLIEKIIDSAIHPIVFVANEFYKVPKAIKGKCELIKFNPPEITEVVELVRKISKNEKREVKFNSVTTDVRNSIISAIFGGDKYESVDFFETIRDLIKGNNPNLEHLDYDDKRNLPIWILDNLDEFYYGRRILDALDILSSADITKNLNLLKLLPKGSSSYPKKPYFFEKLKVKKSVTK